MALCFEIVAEVLIETDIEIRRDFVTLATFPYCPKITLSCFKPAEILDDYILKSVPVFMPQVPRLENLTCPQFLQDAEICIEAIISSNDEIVKLVELELGKSKYEEKLKKIKVRRATSTKDTGAKEEILKEEKQINFEDDEATIKAKIQQ